MFLGILFGLSFLVSGAMLVTATMKPQWFMIGPGQAHPDSLQMKAKNDSLAAIAKRDSSSLAPSLGQAEAHNTAASAAAGASGQPGAVPSSPDTAGAAQRTELERQQELQSLVKLYDAMKPEDAARILTKQEDRMIRSVILRLKKKQAARILSFFNADRAAQILAQ